MERSPGFPNDWTLGLQRHAFRHRTLRFSMPVQVAEDSAAAVSAGVSAVVEVAIKL